LSVGIARWQRSFFKSDRQIPALLLFLWVGSGALRRVRGRSSQVKGACGVAARVNAAELTVQ
jgi:hypothetical protein